MIHIGEGQRVKNLLFPHMEESCGWSVNMKQRVVSRRKCTGQVTVWQSMKAAASGDQCEAPAFGFPGGEEGKRLSLAPENDYCYMSL